LNLYGYNVDAVIINRIIEESDNTSFFARYAQSQQQYIKEIEESFAGLPIFRVEHQGQEVFGADKLAKLAYTLYGKTTPTNVLHNESPYQLTEDKEGYVLAIKLPFLKNKQFGVNKFGDEIVIQLGNKRKNVFLPRFVNYYQLTNHYYEEPWLKIRLSK
jgi:arsenite-transporting ATPase